MISNSLRRCWTTPLALALASILLVTACAEREIILPGKREPISADQQAVYRGQDAVSAADARPFRAPAPVANANWTQGFGTPAFRTMHPALGATMTRIWSVDIGAGDSRKYRINAEPVVADGRIFTLDADSRVTAVSTAGTVLWTTDIAPRDGDRENATGGGLAEEGGVLYVSSGYGTLVALDAATGAQKWRQDLEATASGRPTIFGGYVYVLAGDDTGWALRSDNGRVAWQISAAASVGNVLGAPAPVVLGDLVVFGFGSGEIQAAFRRGGLRRWDSSVLGERQGRALSKIDDVTGTPVAVGDVIYAGSQAGRTVALRVNGGERIWTAQEGAFGTVLPVGDSVFLISDRNELLRLDARTGARVWGTELPYYRSTKPRRTTTIFAHYGPILAGGRLIVASDDGQLRFFDPSTGVPTGAIELPDGATTSPVVAGQTLYVVSSKGQLHAFR